MTSALLRTTVALALATPLAAHAQQPGPSAVDVPGLVKVMTDPGQPMEKREEALRKAASHMARQPSPRGGPLKDALGPLIDRALPKRTDPIESRWLIFLLRTTEIFMPFPEMSGRVRPLLAKDTPEPLREAAVRAIQVHKISGVAAELEAYVREPVTNDPGRQGTERAILDATVGFSTPDAVRVIAAALKVSTFRGVRVFAARMLGEHRNDAGRKALLEACSPEEKDELVAAEAAIALVRHGSFEGAGALLERLKTRGTSTVYKALCRTALRELEGFAGVPPEQWNQAGKEGRAAAVAEAVQWWSTSRPRSREDVLFDALKARGVNVPADRRGKESISALIDGLSVDPASLRYAALDLFVERTGKTDLAEDFRTLTRVLRGSAAVREPEPGEGFTDPMRRDMLKQQQVEKQAKIRSWWDSVKARAENVNGRWVVRG